MVFRHICRVNFLCEGAHLHASDLYRLIHMCMHLHRQIQKKTLSFLRVFSCLFFSDILSILGLTLINLFASHLLSNLSCKVLVLLLHSFACFETNEALNCDLCAVCLSNLSNILSYGLLAILSLNINLI